MLGENGEASQMGTTSSRWVANPENKQGRLFLAMPLLYAPFLTITDMKKKVDGCGW